MNKLGEKIGKAAGDAIRRSTHSGYDQNIAHLNQFAYNFGASDEAVESLNDIAGEIKDFAIKQGEKAVTNAVNSLGNKILAKRNPPFRQTPPRQSYETAYPFGTGRKAGSFPLPWPRDDADIDSEAAKAIGVLDIDDWEDDAVLIERGISDGISSWTTKPSRSIRVAPRSMIYEEDALGDDWVKMGRAKPVGDDWIRAGNGWRRRHTVKKPPAPAVKPPMLSQWTTSTSHRPKPRTQSLAAHRSAAPRIDIIAPTSVEDPKNVYIVAKQYDRAAAMKQRWANKKAGIHEPAKPVVIKTPETREEKTARLRKAAQARWEKERAKKNIVMVPAKLDG